MAGLQLGARWLEWETKTIQAPKSLSFGLEKNVTPSSTIDDTDKLDFFTAGILIFVASVLVFWGWFVIDMAIVGPRRLATQAESWTEVPCSIRMIEVEVVTIRSTGSKGSALKTSTTAYAPRVEFDYEWQGRSFTSNRFWFGGSLWKSKSQVEEIIAPYLHNDGCVCFVDSDNPSQAVLTRKLFERSSFSGYWVTAIILVGLVFVVATASFLYFLNRNSTCTDTTEIKEPASVNGPCSATQQWMLSIVWNSILGTITYFTWVGGAPISFFIFFLGLFWFVGMIMFAVAISKTFTSLRRNT
jgi:hypothetical protein